MFNILKKTFYSNGKLLLTGEYAVLDGAKAFALPTKFGQSLHTEFSGNDRLYWKSFDADGSIWYEDTILINEIKNNSYKGENFITKQLTEILYSAHNTNPKILNTGYNVITELTFPRKWGLGTSSTLINNIAQWFGIDAYQLLWKSFGGSGYDIACAQNDSAILYRIENELSVVIPVNFKPEYADKLYFVYLNQKQDSRKAIVTYREKKGDIADAIGKITVITDEIYQAKTINDFSVLLEEHEAVMTEILGIPTIKKLLFPDFKGTLKSLGAWGGDFILAVAEDNPADYFNKKGYDTVIPYNEMIL
ncbi:GHMP kinase [Flavobacterium sp. LaA7.5]|nr:GHMP kinase [Flavobacterium salilacus subsp. altitudinum]